MNEAAPSSMSAIVEGIDKIPRDAWDACSRPTTRRFVEWDWLRAMEHSGSAARDTGWAPYHLIVRQGPKKQIVAACPLYLKTHSMGEFVFDHGWADAAERAGSATSRRWWSACRSRRIPDADFSLRRAVDRGG